MQLILSDSDDHSYCKQNIILEIENFNLIPTSNRLNGDKNDMTMTFELITDL